MKDQEYDYPRFTVNTNSSKKAAIYDDDSKEVAIYDDEFHWDATLPIYGDFMNTSDRVRYAQAICDVLNENLPRIPRE